MICENVMKRSYLKVIWL